MEVDSKCALAIFRSCASQRIDDRSNYLDLFSEEILHNYSKNKIYLLQNAVRTGGCHVTFESFHSAQSVGQLNLG